MPCIPGIKGTFANSVDPDQTPQYAVSDRGLLCLQKKGISLYKNSYNLNQI